MTKNKRKTWKTEILELLATTKLITFATVSENIPWSSPLFFTYDSRLALYFLLDINSQHMKNLIFLPKAAVTLHHQTLTSQLQFIGDVEIFSEDSIQQVQKQYNELSAIHSGDIADFTIGHLGWKIAKFIPQKTFIVSATNPLGKQEIHLTNMLQNYFLTQEIN